MLAIARAGLSPFGQRLGAVHDRVAAIETERILEPVEALAGALITTVGKPAVGLQQDRRAEILVLVPPVARARRRAAEAQDALPHAIELGAVLGRLPALAVRRRLIRLQPRLDQLVLRVQSGQVGDEILQDRQVRQRRDPARSWLEAVDRGQTGERVGPIDVHRAGAAHAFTAGSPERQRRIDLVVDLDQRVENHRSALIEIDFEHIDRRVGVLVRIPAIDPEALDVRAILSVRGQCLPSPTLEFAGSVNSDISDSPGLMPPAAIDVADSSECALPAESFARRWRAY